jgi:hypothetical protein
MANRKAFFIAALAAILFVPDGTFARGGGFAARGPVFGFHPRIVGQRPFRPIVHPVPSRFGWQLRWRKERARHRAGAGAILDGGLPASNGDVTGTATVPTVFVPPAVPPAPPERIGCYARGYEVPGESGGVVRVTVTRC